MGSPLLVPWVELVTNGTRRALSGLAHLMGGNIDMAALTLRRVPVGEISDLFGGPQAQTIGISFTVSGSAEGRLMLMYERDVAYGFVDMLLAQPPGTTTSLDDMGRSALGELGNIVGSCFLTAIADAAGVTLAPSPPTIVTDVAGALLEVVTEDIVVAQDETYLAEATFLAQACGISGVFMVMPTEEQLEPWLASRSRVLLVGGAAVPPGRGPGTRQIVDEIDRSAPRIAPRHLDTAKDAAGHSGVAHLDQQIAARAA